MSTFFVVSTGRSGSQSVAHALSQSERTLCLHEPDPAFVRSITLYASGLLPRGALARRFRGSRPLVDIEHYGETNNRFALALEPLQDAFPEARFVWVRRDARAFVCSQLQRGAYGTPLLRRGVSTWERWRPRGDLVGAMSSADWRAMSPFARICWVWSWTNDRIERDLKGREVFVLPTHEISSRIRELAAFLDLPDEPYVVPRSNTRRLNPGARGELDAVRTAADWSIEQHAVFERHCGASMDRYFPGWRSSPAPVDDAIDLTAAEHERCNQGVERVRRAEAHLRQQAVERSPLRRCVSWARRSRPVR